MFHSRTHVNNVFAVCIVLLAAASAEDQVRHLRLITIYTVDAPCKMLT